MTHQEQETAWAAHLRELLAAGIAAGYWAPVADPTQRETLPTSARVESKSGGHFYISVGGWRQDGKAHARVADRTEDTLRVTVSDCRDVRNVEASASLDRGYAAVAKALHSRVIAHPDGIAAAAAVYKELQDRCAQRRMLAARVASVAKLGYEVAYNARDHQHRDQPLRLADGHYHSVPMWGGAGRPSLDLRHDGGIRFTDSVYTTTANLAALLPLLGR